MWEGNSTKALAEANYGKWSYSSVPRGFALVTQIEQIKDDGTPRPDPDRFSTDLPSFQQHVFCRISQAMAKSAAGTLPVIVFVRHRCAPVAGRRKANRG
jgi:hypothetical protein